MNRTTHDFVPAIVGVFSLVAIAVSAAVGIAYWALIPWVFAFLLGVVLQIEHEFRLRRRR